MARIETVAELEALYGMPVLASTGKVASYITPEYAEIIRAAPFAALATSGPEGLDCSPRGDKPGFMRIHDDHTLMMPDRRGNNRVDSLRNIVRDPRIALMFMIPGVGNALRVNGRAYLETDPALLDSFVMEGKAPRSVIVMEVDEVYFQCARAIIRAKLWDPEARVDPRTLPSPGQILDSMTRGEIKGEEYDRTWGERARQTMW